MLSTTAVSALEDGGKGSSAAAVGFGVGFCVGFGVGFGVSFGVGFALVGKGGCWVVFVSSSSALSPHASSTMKHFKALWQ